MGAGAGNAVGGAAGVCVRICRHASCHSSSDGPAATGSADRSAPRGIRRPAQTLSRGGCQAEWREGGVSWGEGNSRGGAEAAEETGDGCRGLERAGEEVSRTEQFRKDK